MTDTAWRCDVQEVIRRTKGSELPDIGLTWYQQDGTTLYDFSSGWTFAVRIGSPGLSALVTPSAVGAATAPNITITFAADALNTIPAGSYHLDVTPRFTALTKDLDTRTWLFQVLEAVAA
jgi:hypothetical protein